MIDGERNGTCLTEWSTLVDHALTEQFVEWLIDAMEAKVSKCLGVESSVNQVHLGVFNSTTIEVNVHPIIGNVCIVPLFKVVGIGISQEVPG